MLYIMDKERGRGTYFKASSLVILCSVLFLKNIFSLSREELVAKESEVHKHGDRHMKAIKATSGSGICLLVVVTVWFLPLRGKLISARVTVIKIPSAE